MPRSGHDPSGIALTHALQLGSPRDRHAPLYKKIQEVRCSERVPTVLNAESMHADLQGVCAAVAIRGRTVPIQAWFSFNFESYFNPSRIMLAVPPNRHSPNINIPSNEFDLWCTSDIPDILVYRPAHVALACLRRSSRRVNATDFDEWVNKQCSSIQKRQELFQMLDEIETR